MQIIYKGRTVQEIIAKMQAQLLSWHQKNKHLTKL